MSAEGGAVTDDVRRWVLEHYLGMREPKPEPIEATKEELAAVTGFLHVPLCRCRTRDAVSAGEKPST